MTETDLNNLRTHAESGTLPKDDALRLIREVERLRTELSKKGVEITFLLSRVEALVALLT
jgi:hypothetical protein